MPESVKKSIEILPFFEKITNIQSVWMIFVVIFTVDLSLLFSTDTNLLTYSWSSMQHNMHYGKIALFFGASLFFYVLIVPVINGIFWKIVFQLDWEVIKPICKMLKFPDENEDWVRKNYHSKWIPTRALKFWAIDNDDKFAYELAKEKTLAHQLQSHRNETINNLCAALMFLLVLEYATVNSVWFELNRLTSQHASGDFQTFLFVALALTFFMPLVSWWLTRFPTEDQSLIYYPKAASERYEAYKKNRSH